MSDGQASGQLGGDTVATFRHRMRAYFVRVAILFVALVAVLFVAQQLIRLTPLAGDTAGAVLGIVALVGLVGGSYVVHWRTVRCPSCERWLVPLGLNGFAPRSCPRCNAQLR